MSSMGSPQRTGSSDPCQPSSSSMEISGSMERSPEREILPVARSSMLARRLVRLRACSRRLSSTARRRKREMIPADQKDATYWTKRHKNNEAAKRSREKRRLNDLLLEGQLLALSEENAQLRAKVLNLHYHASVKLEKTQAASNGAASPPTFSLSSHPPPAFIQAAGHLYDAKISCFSPTGGASIPMGHHGYKPQQCTPPLSGPFLLSHGAALGGTRLLEVDPQLQVSLSGETSFHAEKHSKPLSSLQAFLPTLDPLPHLPSFSYPAPNWVMPHLNNPPAYNHLLHWRSSYMDVPHIYPRLPLHIQGRQDQGVEVEDSKTSSAVNADPHLRESIHF